MSTPVATSTPTTTRGKRKRETYLQAKTREAVTAAALLHSTVSAKVESLKDQKAGSVEEDDKERDQEEGQKDPDDHKQTNGVKKAKTHVTSKISLKDSEHCTKDNCVVIDECVHCLHHICSEHQFIGPEFSGWSKHVHPPGRRCPVCRQKFCALCWTKDQAAHSIHQEREADCTKGLGAGHCECKDADFEDDIPHLIDQPIEDDDGEKEDSDDS